MSKAKILEKVLVALAALAGTQLSLEAEDVCGRFPQGSMITQPEDLYSKDGVLEVDFTYQSREDDFGKILYCFTNSDGAQSPTLHVNPGDVLIINLTNLVPDDGKMPDMPGMEVAKAGEGGCGDLNMTSASVNMHYHGTNTPPVCHEDEVIHTIINTGQTFRYELHFPKNEPPGLYWYHPHIHGIATAAVQGGASGAIIVEGIENVNPEVAGLPQELIIVRDHQPVNPPPHHRSKTHRPSDDDGAPDLSVNYVPIGGPAYIPAEYTMKPGEKQFWRVLNAAAVTILDLQLLYNGERQPLQLIALDGVSLGSQDGSGKGTSLTRKRILIPPAGRAEFIVKGPQEGVTEARLITSNVDTGPAGDPNPTRPLFDIKLSANADPGVHGKPLPKVSGPPPAPRFANLGEAAMTATRKLYFSEDDSFFYITVAGQTPKPFSMSDPPSIVTTQGAVEDWIVENRSQENHEFHMHQIHFLLMERDGKTVPASDRQIIDTVDIPYWTGTGPYPSIKVRMDFRGPTVGDFVYHCHILDHEDGGMMAIIRVLPPGSGNSPGVSKK